MSTAFNTIYTISIASPIIFMTKETGQNLRRAAQLQKVAKHKQILLTNFTNRMPQNESE